MLLLSDYYQVEFSDYFNALKNIAEHSDKPILFYYFPQITGRFFSAEQLLKIVSINNIIGIKDSSLHPPTAKKILVNAPEIQYFSGLSLTLDSLVKHGAAGAICPLATILPQHAHNYLNAIKQKHNDIEELRSELITVLPIVNSLKLPANLQYRALKVLSACPVPLIKSVTSSHAKIKYALQVLGIEISHQPRSLLPDLNINDKVKIKKILQRFI